MSERIPNFLIIGAPKCGTTSLYYYLKQHPQVFMSDCKEPYYFISEKEKAIRAKAGMNPTMTLDQYKAHFADAGGALAVGEASVPYLFQPESPQLIREAIPHAKLIAVLRNPVDRAYSNYWFLRKMRLETAETFEQAVQSELDGERENMISILLHLRKGLYANQLKRYFVVFPREQMRIYLQESLASSPHVVLKDIWRFLGVDETFLSDTSERFNQTLVENASIAAQPKAILKKLMARLTHNALVGSSPGNSNNLSAPPAMKLETRQALVNHFSADVLELQELINQDLSHWLRS